MTVSDGFRTIFKHLQTSSNISWFLHVSGTRGKCGAFGLGGSGTWRSGRSGRSGRSEGVTTRVWCVSMFRTSCGRTQQMTPIGPIPIPFPNLTGLFWFSLEQSCTDCFFFFQVFAGFCTSKERTVEWAVINIFLHLQCKLSSESWQEQCKPGIQPLGSSSQKSCALRKPRDWWMLQPPSFNFLNGHRFNSLSLSLLCLGILLKLGSW